MPTATEVSRLFERFRAEGPREWPDGQPILESQRVLAFAYFVWTAHLELPDGGGGVYMPGARDPVEVLRGSRDSRAMADRVNRSPIGQMYASQGKPLARKDHWEEIVVPLPNPTGVVWGYSPVLRTYAGAGAVENGVFILSFGPGYTPVLDGLRKGVDSPEAATDNGPSPDRSEPS